MLPATTVSPTTAASPTAVAPTTTSSPTTAPPPAMASPDSAPADDAMATRLGVIPWSDPVAAGSSHDPRSAYVETFWLPTIGPSTTLLIRRLADEFDAEPDGFEIDRSSLSREIGLGTRVDAKSRFARTIERAERFGLVQHHGGILHVRRTIPDLSPRQVARLGERLQALHHSWTLDPTDDGAQRRTELKRAAHLARTLLALGESSHQVELQLHRWHFHPSIAWHAVQWALTGPDQLP